MELKLAHLYPDLLNIYGDTGNIAVLAYRCQKRGIGFNLRPVSLADKLTPGGFDLVFGGGGQDRQQIAVSRDLDNKKKVLIQAAKSGVPMLTVCGTYQLFGQFFRPAGGPPLPGIGLFPAETIASKQRKIGNIVINLNSKISPLTSKLVGFENHSGNTRLDDRRCSLGKVIRGFGNNGRDATEGCRVNNAVGTYLHGPVLAKNPHLADWLIASALKIKYGRTIKLKPLNDKLEWQAHAAAVKIAYGPGCWNW